MQIRQTGFFKYFPILIFSLILLISISAAIVKMLEEKRNAEIADNQILGIESPTEELGLPIRLTIPAINVDAGIQLLGMTTGGQMDVPSNAVDVGWYDLGPRPGEKGSAVIAGHFDGEDDEKGVFANLDTLKRGDRIYVKDHEGKTIAFEVQEKRTYDPGYADDVFLSQTNSAHLNLVTCGGLWNERKHQYSKRIVVFSDIIEEE